MIRQNRAVPILLVLTLAWVLYLGGCFGSEEAEIASEDGPTVVAEPTATPILVVAEAAADAPPAEEPYVHTIAEGDLLPDIASKFGVTVDVIRRANPGLDPSLLIVGDQLLIPGATTDNTALENVTGADRAPNQVISYIIADGDTLGAIADEYIVSAAAIIDANPEINPNALQIGTFLTIPPRGTGLTDEQLAAFETPEPVERQPGEIAEYTVQAGDVLSTIADRYQVTVDEIIAANLLQDANNIAPGDLLRIPAPSQTDDG